MNGKESVWVHFLSDTFEEDWKIMMVIELLNVDFPVDLILWSVFNGNWKITSVVEESEFTYWDVSPVDGAGNWFLDEWLWLGLV